MSKEYLGARLTKSEHSFLEDLANRNGSTKTDALRKLLAAAMNGSKSDERLEQLINHMGVILSQNKSLWEEGRYTSLLLTSLVQRVAKGGDPAEAQKMIEEASEKARRVAK